MTARCGGDGRLVFAASNRLSKLLAACPLQAGMHQYLKYVQPGLPTLSTTVFDTGEAYVHAHLCFPPLWKPPEGWGLLDFPPSIAGALLSPALPAPNRTDRR